MEGAVAHDYLGSSSCHSRFATAPRVSIMSASASKPHVRAVSAAVSPALPYVEAALLKALGRLSK